MIRNKLTASITQYQVIVARWRVSNEELRSCKFPK